MNRIIVALFALFALFALSVASAQATQAEPEFGLSARGEIIVEADGSVRSYTLDEGLSPEVSELVARNVATWRFEPILVDDVPVVARTRMSLSILAMPRGEGGFILKVEDAWFGDLKSRFAHTPPRYPTRAIKAGLGARVMLVLKIDEEGNVVAAHPYQTSLSQQGNEVRAQRWRRLFEKSSIAAAMSWKYEPGEIIGGKAVTSTVMVPFVYSIETSQGVRRSVLENRWRAYVPGPITPAPWVDASSMAAVDGDNLADGKTASLDSRFRLVSDVIGKAL